MSLFGLNGDLPEEIFSEVTTFLPAYSFVGQYAIHNVCQKWNKLLASDNQVLSKKHHRAMVDSCRSSEDALNILSDPTLIQILSLDEFFQVVSFHPEITKMVIEKYGSNINPVQVTQLLSGYAKEDLSFAKYLIKLTALGKELNLYQDLILDKATLDPEPFMSKPKPLNLILEIGKAHVSVAWDIITASRGNEITAAIFNASQFLYKWAEAHLSIAKYIMETPNLMATAPYHYNIAAHPSLTARIKNNPEIFNALDKNRLLSMGVADLPTANRILETEDLLMKLGGVSQLKPFGEAHLSIAKRLLNPSIFELIPDSDSKYFLSWLGEAHLEIAELIMNSPDLLAKIEKSYSFAHYHAVILKRILANSENRENILKDIELVSYFMNDFSVRDSIFKENVNNPDKWANLTNLALKHPDMMLRVISHPELSKKLDIEWNISTHHFGLMQSIMENQALRERMRDSNLETYAAIFSDVKRLAEELLPRKAATSSNSL